MSNSPVSPAAAAAELLRRRQARRSLLAFTRYTMPSFEYSWHHGVMCEYLDRFVALDIKRLIISMPPRHTKSEFVSRRLPAFILGQNPDAPIIAASYGADLARRMNRDVQRIIDDAAYRRLFPDTKLFGSNVQTVAQGSWLRNSDMFEVVEYNGYYRGSGVGGAITGMGMKYGIIDDPLKNRADANSETIRQKIWDWYTSTFRTRLAPGGGILITMCMTGDTPVLMADGTERPLRDIRVGDCIATYDNGKLGTSVVLNHRSNGPDSVYRIRTICGIIVYANARHPFLVEEDGRHKWIRLKDLCLTHKIVVVRDGGAYGRERPVWPKDATNLLMPAAIAGRTTRRSGGRMGIDHHPSILSLAAMHASSDTMVSPPSSMTPCMRRRGASAPSVVNPLARMCALTGVANFVSTTATKPTPCAHFFATTATWLWDIPKHEPMPLLLPNTSNFTTTLIESIELAGVEEVFDIQVDRTENFIANGLVSHNTRWHEDDLVGRLLSQSASDADADQWTVLTLPAIAENPIADYDQRQVGDALWPTRFDLAELAKTRVSLGSYDWNSLYQQRPAPPEGGMFKRQWFDVVGAAPRQAARVRAWDKAASDDSGDYTVGVLLARDHKGIFYVEDVIRDRLSDLGREKVIRQTADADRAKYGDVKVWIEQEPGSGGKDSARMTVRGLAGHSVHVERPTTDKVVRAGPFAAQCEAENVRLVAGEWNAAYISELASFPYGSHDDQVDASTLAFNKLALELQMPANIDLGGLTQSSKWKT